jgi:hypothetical protein
MYLAMSKYSQSIQVGGETEGCNGELYADCLSILLCDDAHDKLKSRL